MQGEEWEAPLTWADTHRSALGLHVRHLCLFGLWPLHGSRAFRLYTGCGLLLGLWNAVEGAAAAGFSWGDLDSVSLALLTATNQGCGALKMALFLRARRRFCALVRRLDALLAARGGGGPRGEAALRRARRLTLSTLLFMLSQCFVWYPIPLVAHRGERRLPFAQHPWDGNRRCYALSYLAQCAAGLLMMQISFGVDCLFVSAMILVAAQLETLAMRIRDMAVVDTCSHNGKSEYSEKKLARRGTDEMYDLLCRSIEDHQKILRFVTHLQDIMSPIAIMQFGASTLVICFILFQATYSEDFSSAFKCTAFLPVACTQVYLYCWAANEVTVQVSTTSKDENNIRTFSLFNFLFVHMAEAVSVAAYSCSWVEASSSFKLTLRILISRAQKPLILTAGRLYHIDKETFLSIVNASYSYYALLSQTTSR